MGGSRKRVSAGADDGYLDRSGRGCESVSVSWSCMLLNLILMRANSGKVVNSLSTLKYIGPFDVEAL